MENVKTTETGNVKVYLVLSISEMRAMLKIASAHSKTVYDGKVRGQSCSVLRATVLMEESHRSADGSYQVSSAHLTLNDEAV